MPDPTLQRPARPVAERPPLRLWHYTCRDAVHLIREAGVLRPGPHPWLPEPVVWATDLEPDAVPDLDLALGLRGEHTRCDRTEYRFEVIEAGAFEPWSLYARRQIRAGVLDRSARELLDTTPGGFPRHWYVSTLAVRARHA